MSYLGQIIGKDYQTHQFPLNSLRTEGILKKLQKVMKLTQKWKDFENRTT
jgi:hypothetical protein